MLSGEIKARVESLYDNVVDLVFRGHYQPGAKLVEEKLAAELGVSRVPLRETLARLVGQGLLVRGERGEGVRLREYSVDDVRQLYEYREVLEGVAAAAAARVATSADIAQMEILCEQAQVEIAEMRAEKWPDLEYRFHLALNQASHNSRITSQARSLLTECRYLFFVLPYLAFGFGDALRSEEASAQMKAVLEDHLALVELIRSRNPEEAERKARADMRTAAERLVRIMITKSLSET